MKLIRSVPALPVTDATEGARFYRDRLGFTIAYQDGGFAKLQRDDVELHLWQADDQGWRRRQEFASYPVCSGAESFICGTASCRVEVDDIDALYVEMATAGVLHYGDSGSAQDTEWGTREFAVTDSDNNLVTFYSRRPPT